MLVNLLIENIAVIERADIHFSTGFNVMTGETGAGKSIVIDAINAILGERTSKELVRNGASRASVTALFEHVSADVTAKLEQHGIEAEPDHSLLLNRVISLDAKSSCRVNGRPVTVSMLRDIAGELINIHGQHDSQSLLNPDKHIRFVDLYAKNNAVLAAYKQAYTRYCKIRRELSSLEMDAQEKARRIELLQFQINELEHANLRVGEEQELKNRRVFIANAQTVLDAAHTAYRNLEGEEESSGAKQLVLDAVRALTEAAVYFPQFTQIAKNLEEITYTLEEYTDQLREDMQLVEADPAELTMIEERLDELYKLEHKYGADEPAMLAYLEQARQELESIEFSEERAQTLKEELETAKEAVFDAAERLTRSRVAAGEALSKEIKASLALLDMPNTSFNVAKHDTAAGSNGAESMEFLISTNPGEPPKPLSKIASGGELSRIMLAIKNVLTAQDDIGTLIFDEIDTGVSGRAAQKIGRMMKHVANGRQVICVTHLSQIAAMGDHHLLIEKSVEDGRTFTKVIPLDFEGRTHEIARINGGENITQLQLENAAEMLKSANAT